MKKLLLVIILNVTFLIFHSVCFAQNVKIDSLLNLIKTDKADSNNVIHLITLCNEYRKIAAYENGLKYGKEALQIATAIASQKYRASAYNTIGNIYYNQGNYADALKNYVASLQINEELKNKKD